MTADIAGQIPAQALILLTVVFLVVAMLYSSVGLGGGSAYTAMMTIAGINFVLIPTISLSLNLIVTFIGMINFGRNGFIKPRLIAPFLITSIPMAYVGGALELSREIFLWLLLFTLVLVALRIYILGNLSFKITLTSPQRLVLALSLGALLGFIAGTVGIGGGIYLVPLLIMFSLAGEKEAAAAGAVYVSRWTSLHVRRLTASISEAFVKNGFSFVEVVASCPTSFGRKNKLGKPLEILQHFHRMSTIKNEIHPKDATLDIEKEIVVGKFVDVERPTFFDLLREIYPSGKEDEASL